MFARTYKCYAAFTAVAIQLDTRVCGHFNRALVVTVDNSDLCIQFPLQTSHFNTLIVFDFRFICTDLDA